MDEVAEAQGAWINNWAQQELGADLEQLQEMVVAGQGLPFDQMDEGSSSSEEEEEEGEEDEEQGHFALGLDGDGEAGFGAGNGGGAAAAAAAAGPQAPPVQVSAVETLLRAVTRRNTRARNRLRVPLSRPVGANIALVKLISQVCRCLLRLLGCLLTRPCDTVLVVISMAPGTLCAFVHTSSAIHSASVLVLCLQENLMDQYGDPHSWCVQLRGAQQSRT